MLPGTLKSGSVSVFYRVVGVLNSSHCAVQLCVSLTLVSGNHRKLQTRLFCIPGVFDSWFPLFRGDILIHPFSVFRVTTAETHT